MDEIARELAAKIHNMNNEWQAVLGRVELALATMGEPDALRRQLERLHHSARRGGSLGREAMVLAAQLASRRTEVDLNALLGEVAADCEDLLAPHCRVQVSPAETPLWTRINQEGFSDALLNLAANARDAMPSGGTFFLSAVLQDEGRLVCIQVRDEGLGMSEAVRARCFDDFYTTKGVHGTGLGLPAVKRFVEAHQGRLRLETAPGKGSMFELCFPRMLERAGLMP